MLPPSEEPGQPVALQFQAEAGRVGREQDAVPRYGRAGEAVLDRHGLRVPAAAGGPYALLVGLYADDGRLHTVDGADAVKITLD